MQVPICLDCEKVYDPRTEYRTHTILVPYDKELGDFTREVEHFCPNMSCRGSLVFVDENMINMIFMLNKMGYVTTACCASHPWDDYVKDSKDDPDLEMWINIRKPFPPMNPKDPRHPDYHGIPFTIKDVNEHIVRIEWTGDYFVDNPVVHRWELYIKLYKWICSFPHNPL